MLADHGRSELCDEFLERLCFLADIGTGDSGPCKACLVTGPVDQFISAPAAGVVLWRHVSTRLARERWWCPIPGR